MQQDHPEDTIKAIMMGSFKDLVIEDHATLITPRPVPVKEQDKDDQDEPSKNAGPEMKLHGASKPIKASEARCAAG